MKPDHAISRQQLYALVWSEPMTKVAASFSVSGSYLARVCTLLKVPRPERGYWAKLAVGKAGPAPQLPEALPGDPLHWPRIGDPLPSQARPRRPRAQFKRRRIPRDHVHGLVRGAREHFLHSRRIEDWAYLKPYKKLLVDVVASEAGLTEALGLANEFFNALESLGHRVVIAPAGSSLRHVDVDEREVRTKPRDRYFHTGLWYPGRPTVVYVGEVALGLSIVEMSEHVLLRYVDGKYIRESEYLPPRQAHRAGYTWTTMREIPSGRFRIIAYSPYPGVAWSLDWQETTKSPLRKRLGAIAREISDAAPSLVEKIEEAERQSEIRRQEWLAAEERHRRENDRRAVERSVRDSTAHLNEVIESWSKAISVESFLSEVERRAADLPESRRCDVLERLRLARLFLGVQDPIQHFLSWLTPQERYQPRYPAEAERG